jgi:hypothetical protein
MFQQAILPFFLDMAMKNCPKTVKTMPKASKMLPLTH